MSPITLKTLISIVFGIGIRRLFWIFHRLFSQILVQSGSLLLVTLITLISMVSLLKIKLVPITISETED